MVGIIGLSTANANIVEQITFAHETSFRVFQISMPAWGALIGHVIGDVLWAESSTWVDLYRFLVRWIPATIGYKSAASCHT